MAAPKKTKESQAQKRKRKARSVESSGIAHIFSTFNNTVITFADSKGNTISWASGGVVGFSGTRKGTPFAAGSAAQKAAKEAKDLGLQKVEVWVKGPGPGRETAIRAIQSAGIEVIGIKDVTPIPHNGCRPPKRRRV
ncbi:MAG TPA: 30S ribosomal protein S11 [Candidatus Hydrothermia bacterium]|nr:30S ribosomal protein S11 [Candidatus Hydrothermae bacterium]MDD3648950.1 30S ribosomal protein S11 [Candidatus Hydrothermia bacterium]MDD5573452.1 30S ribosomal protein S11 [Candidatus Hydrothermia bacterium]HOK23191.1 30S ribosomal protein S11 [Candidatus Hydrothermia bacterium]HOL23895.1 30S ribosomal protein S11 [Candidatus Hydrothermia bacterium]